MDSIFTAPPGTTFIINSDNKKWSIWAHIGAFLHTRFVWADFEYYQEAAGVLNPGSYIELACSPFKMSF